MYKSGKDPINYPNHNVLKELIKSNSPITSHNVQLSGGSEKFNYYISLNYLYQGGMWETTNMHKYSLMSKIQAQATKTTKIELAVTGRIEQYNYPGVASGGAGNIFLKLFVLLRLLHWFTQVDWLENLKAALYMVKFIKVDLINIVTMLCITKWL